MIQKKITVKSKHTSDRTLKHLFNNYYSHIKNEL